MCALRGATGFPLDALTFVVSHFLPHLTHPGSFSPKAITASRRMRRRSTTRPAASSPTRLQLFLPRSIPRTAIVIVPLPSSY